MKYAFKIFIIIAAFTSCAKLPIQSVNLMDALVEEGERMHQINLVFLNSIFKSKKEKVDEFIKTQYSPKFIADFQKNIPKDADVKAELPNIMNAIAPKISERRDAMQNALEEQRIKLSNKLELDYRNFASATSELRMLLLSATEVDKERQILFNKTKTLTKGTLDLNAVDGSIDHFINSGGNLGNDLSDLNNAINAIIKK